MNVLAVGCHPDDIEIACAGTLARYKSQGHHVVMTRVTDGDMGHKVIMPHELCAIRSAESKRAAALLDVEVLSCHGRDVCVRSEYDALRDKLTDIVRYTKPDVIITHSPEDYMPDHVAVCNLVFDASITCTIGHYRPDVPMHDLSVPIYYMDTLAGVSFQPSEYVDITEHMELKLAMLCCHESQIKWMADHENIDFPDFVRTCSKYRGLQCGVAYAEAFTRCMRWPKVTPGRLLP